MYTLWLVSEEPALSATLAVHLRALGSIFSGAPDAGQFKDADPPDLVVLASGADPDSRALERLLGFLRRVPHPERAPAPVLFLEPSRGRSPTALLRSLVDDRPLTSLGWPLDPDGLVTEAARLLGGSDVPASLRERARREWVSSRVERLYAGLELPALRHAIDPRNAPRPVLLVGEPGTRRGMLARYIHNLAEPPRQELILLPVEGLAPSEIESAVLARSVGRRTSVFLQGLDRGERFVQEELLQLIGESGAMGIESIRWIASVARADALLSALRMFSWIRVDLPALRNRDDLPELARALTDTWCLTNRRSLTLADEAIDTLRDYLWPGNLRELEAVLNASLSAATGDVLTTEDLRFVTSLPPELPTLELELTGPPAQEPRSEPPSIVEPPPPVEAAPEPAPLIEPEAILEPEPELIEPDEVLEPEPELIEPDGVLEAGPERVDPAPDEKEPDALAYDAGHSYVPVRDIVAPLAEEIRQPLRALRTCASLLEQRPNDVDVRRDLQNILNGDLVHIDEMLQRLERFTSFGPPRLERVDVPALVASELQSRHDAMRQREVVVLRELDHDAPPALGDERQLRFAIGALLDRALRMVPAGGDLYVGSLQREADDERPAAIRLLIRFHSPEEVLVGPADLPGADAPIEVVLARDLIQRMGGAFAIDASGSQDNVILIELQSS